MDVRTICLGLLSVADRSGYEIKKMLEEGPLGHFVEASFGSIYPALTKLTEDGLVEFRTETQDGRPDKKTYSITQQGREAFRQSLDGRIAPDKFRSDFMFIFMFADQLSPQRVARLIDERLDYYDSKIATIRAEIGDETRPGPCFVAGHAITIFEAAKAYLEENRHLLERQNAQSESRPLSLARAD